MRSHMQQIWQRWLGSLTFYTRLPIPQRWSPSFDGIALYAPWVGLLIGGLQVGLDVGLGILGFPIGLRSALVVAAGLLVTGGLHLDGAMDTADGLAVLDPQKRLEVMADSRTGAFGAMAAVWITLLKVLALMSLTHDRGLALMLSAAWGRWGQLRAIASYPYLKPQGKGAFHRDRIRSPWQGLPSALGLLGLCAGYGYCWPDSLRLAIVAAIGGWGLSFAIGAWFNAKLGGQTGDTYGAIVEWTETLLLCLLSGLAGGR